MMKKNNTHFYLLSIIFLLIASPVLTNEQEGVNRQTSDTHTPRLPRKPRKRTSIFAAVDVPEDEEFEEQSDEAQQVQQQATRQDIELLEQTERPTEEFPTLTEALTDRFIEESAKPDDQRPEVPESTERVPEEKKSEKPPVQIKEATISKRVVPEKTFDVIGEYPGEPEPKEEPFKEGAAQDEHALIEMKDVEKPAPPDQEEAIEFYFEDADITNLLTQIEELYNVHFLTDEMIQPLGPGGKALKGNKISFKTHTPLSKRAAWRLFLTFLDLAGFALVPEPEPGFYRVVTTARAQQSPVPTYIGVDADTLPDDDQIVRYVYFIENARPETIDSIVKDLKSPGARAVTLREIKALVITDRSYNIKSLMTIIKDLDQVTMPQSMSVLKLTRADALDVKKLYDSLSKKGEDKPGTRIFGPRKQPTAIYFPEDARIIAEPRTNSLVLLGSVKGIKIIEEFITKYVDVELGKPYSPLHTYKLRYADAITVADIMNQMSQFGKESEVGKVGGVRGGDKYLKPMTFTAEPTTNTLVIKGEYEDYLKALEIIKKLDEPQPQVAIEVLVLTINVEDVKELGTQLRNKKPGPDGLLGNNVDFQTSGIRLGGSPKGIQTRDSGPGATRLLANLITLVQGASAGNTVLTLGTDCFGVWGIFGLLQTITNTQVVSNPFLVATNKTTATVSIGDIRRVVTSTIFAGDNEEDAFGNFEAKLKVEVTPQINSDGMIVLRLNVLIEDFIGDITNPKEAAKATRLIDTRTIVADKEVIALGGLIRNRIEETMTKVPILGDIPIFGWLFKNKRKSVIKDNLLILISTRIIEPEIAEVVDKHTQDKIDDYHNTLDTFHDIGEQRDPVYRRFFDSKTDDSEVVESFLFEGQDEQKIRIEHPAQKLPERGGHILALPEILQMPLEPEPFKPTDQKKRSRKRDARRSIRRYFGDTKGGA